MTMTIKNIFSAEVIYIVINISLYIIKACLVKRLKIVKTNRLQIKTYLIRYFEFLRTWQRKN